MSWKITWTKTAREDYANLLDYVERIHGTDSAIKLLNRVEKIILRIQLFPNIFPFSNKLNGHKAVVTKQTSIIYLIGDNEVFLVRFADSRMK